MSRFEEIRGDERFAKLEPVGASELDELRRAYPGLPADYLAFLEVVGAGEVRDSVFMLYDGLVPPEDIYGTSPSGPVAGLWIFGDDFQGYSSAFDPARGWAVVEIDPMDKSVELVADTFEEFMRAHLLEKAMKR